MLIVLALYGLLIWLVFFKFKWLEYNKLWKNIVWGGAITITLVVLGALQFFTPVSSSAVVSAYTQKIHPQISGQILEVKVKGTELVDEGQLLVKIDPRPFQYEFDRSSAALRLSEIKLNDAKDLVRRGAAAKRTIDAYQAEYDQATAVLNSARFDLENTEILAPGRGFISVSSLKAGQYVSPGTSILSFVAAGELWIACNFKQNGIENIKPGDRAMVTFNISPGVIYDASVMIVPRALTQGQMYSDAVDPTDAIASAKNVYPVRLAFPEGAHEALRKPGSLASVTIITDEENPINILAVILQWIGAWMKYIF